MDTENCVLWRGIFRSVYMIKTAVKVSNTEREGGVRKHTVMQNEVKKRHLRKGKSRKEIATREK